MPADSDEDDVVMALGALMGACTARHYIHPSTQAVNPTIAVSPQAHLVTWSSNAAGTNEITTARAAAKAPKKVESSGASAMSDRSHDDVDASLAELVAELDAPVRDPNARSSRARCGWGPGWDAAAIGTPGCKRGMGLLVEVRSSIVPPLARACELCVSSP